MVAHIFLVNLKDVELLKTCRLVSKSWNADATVSLRTWSKVTLMEGNTEFMKFGALLRRRASRRVEQLPSPFRNIHADGSAYTDAAFINLLLQPELTITGLNLDLCEVNRKLDETKLGCVLDANKLTITSLNIYGSLSGDLNESLFANCEFKFPALRHLQFKDHCQYCACVPIVKNILSLSVPERVTFIISDGDILISLLPQEKVDHLKHLTLDIGPISTMAWRHLGKLRFGELRRFCFWPICITDDEPDHVEQWHLLCKNVSQSLEDFDFETDNNFTLSTDSELTFPNLQIIKLWDQNALYEFTPRRFPSLSKVICCVSSYLRDLNMTNDVVPHRGVQCLQICFGKSSIRSPDEETWHLLTYLGRQFPNVLLLGIDVPRFCESAMSIIYEAFPKITTLILNGSCDFFVLSGTRRPNLFKPVEQIHDRKSIMDFLDLKKILLGRNFSLEPDMINLCMAKIPKLKHLEFYWNKSLSASLFQDSVRHLETIIISNSTTDAYRADMEQVSKLIPNAVTR
ncbi:unnamed protein product [Allacma fusca]|uniref:Uncharacterized protein n=1 Tax=Allacma fusca TaxID=39272 RepID=A0A8J2LHH6_9HEXA|nr:unnamed protein product [Allacma fusca]